MEWRRIFLFFIVLVASCACSSGGSNDRRDWMLDTKKIRVLCTTGQVSFLVRSVGKDLVNVYTLIPSLSDPHTHQLVKGDDELFDGADLIFFSGLGLEGSGSLLRYGASKKALFIGDSIVRERPECILYAGKVPDPHLWMDASLWANGARVIAEALSKLLPEKASLFQANAQEAAKSLLSLHHKMRCHIQSIEEEKRYLLTAHDAFRYFARAYMATEEESKRGTWNKRVCSLEGLAPDSQISTRELKRAVDFCIESNVSCMFLEYGSNRSSLMKVQEALNETGHDMTLVAESLFSDSLGMKGSAQENYDSMLSYDVDIIVNALGKKDGA
jgi:manganese/zinc/iron transport system substrate-binding protein